MRTLDSKGSAAASHLGSGNRSMRRLPTMGLIDRSEGCQMSCSIVGWPGVAFRATGATAGHDRITPIAWVVKGHGQGHSDDGDCKLQSSYLEVCDSLLHNRGWTPQTYRLQRQGPRACDIAQVRTLAHRLASRLAPAAAC